MNRDSKEFRTVRLRTLSLIISALALVVLALGFWQHKFLSQQTRAVLLGNLELAAQKYSFIDPEPEDEVGAVEVFEIEEKSRKVSDFAVRIGPRSEEHGIGAKKILSSEETKFFMQKWSAMHFHYLLSGMCHEPAFIVRFLKGGKPVLATTLCFKCHNFQISFAFEPGLMGFDQDSPNGQAFVAHVKSLFPDSPKWAELEKEQKKKSAPKQ